MYLRYQRFVDASPLILCILALVLFLVVPSSRTVIHAAVNVFATGRTGVKAFLYIIYILSLLGLTYLMPRAFAGSESGSKIFGRVMGFIVTSYALSFIAYIWLAITYHFPLLTYARLYNNGFFTSIQLIHSHVTKGAIAVVGQWLPQGILSHVDTGSPLIGLLPDAVFYFQLILVIGVVTGIYLLWWKIWPAIREQGRFRACAFAALFITSSFMIIKSMFDGGALSFEAFAGVAFFLLAVGGSRKWVKITAVVLTVGHFVLLGTLYLLGYFISDFSYGTYIFEFFTVVLLMSALYAFWKNGLTRFTKLVGLFALIPFCTQFYNNVSIFAYTGLIIDPADGAYVISYEKPEGSSFTSLGTAGKLYVSMFKLDYPVPVASLIGGTGLADNMTPVSVPWQTCLPNAPFSPHSFMLTSATPLTVLGVVSPLYSMKATPVEAGETYYTYSIEINLHPCLDPQAPPLMEEIMAQYSPFFIEYGFDSSDNGNFTAYGTDR